jgi:hypothetical protein
MCTTFRKLDLFLQSGEGRQKPSLLGPLERADQVTGGRQLVSWVR